MSIAFDAKGAGFTGSSSTGGNESHTAASGAYVIAAISVDANVTISTASYAGNSMTQLGKQSFNNVSTNGWLYLYGISNVASGASTVTITTSASCNIAYNTASYTGVGSVSAATTVSGTAASGAGLSQSTTCSAGQMIVQSFGVPGESGSGAITSPTGGTNEFLQQLSFPQTTVSLSDATSNTTFGGSQNFGPGEPYAGIYVVLSTGGSPPDPGLGARTVTQIPNPSVGPQGLRVNKRWPQLPNVAPLHHYDHADQTWQFAFSPAQLLNNPFYYVIQKLNQINTGQVVNIQTVGDSTTQGFGENLIGPGNQGGWPAHLGILLGQYYNCNVNYLPVNARSGYGSAVASLGFTGTGSNNNVINIWNGGVNATGLEGIGEDEYNIVNGGLLAVQFSALGNPKPDVCIVYDGINDIGNGTALTSAQWTASVKTFLTGIGTGNGGVPVGYQGLQNYIPGCPIIWCPQHYSWTISNFATAFYPYQSAAVAALTGNSLPLYPLAQSGINNVWTLDTQQAWNPNAYTQNQIMSAGNDPHPNSVGYEIMARFMLSALMPFVFGTPTYSPINVPNPQVGPMALRAQKRMPYETFKAVSANQALSDGANSTWTFTTSTDGFTQPAFSYRPTIIPNPFVGPMALRNSKRMPYVAQQRQGFGDAASQAIIFGTSTDGLVAPQTRMPPLQIPNPFVGPMALRNAKRMPYVSSQKQGFGDAANQIIGFSTSSDGVVQPGGLMPPLQIPNPFVGPMALRQQKRMPYVGSQRQGFGDAANQSIVFGTSTDGSAAPQTRMPPLVIANPFVGPQALRANKRMPYETYRTTAGQQALSDGANSTWVFATSDDGFVQPVGLMPPLVIPNPFVGPQALRNQKRMPYVSSQRQGFGDGANQVIAFITSDDGFVQPNGVMPPLRIPNPFVGPQALRNSKRMPYVSSQRQGFGDGANVTVTFTTSDDGFVTTNQPQPPLVIPNPFVGPMAMRNRKRMPYTPAVSLAQQALSDGANSTWVFTTSTNGRRGITDAANSTWTFTRSTDGVRGIRDGANLTITVTTVDDGVLQISARMPPLVIPNPFVGPMALRQKKRLPPPSYRAASFGDAANLTLVFATTDDGNVVPFLIDVAGTVVVGPNEIRSVTIPASIFTVLVNQTNFPYKVQ